MWRHFAYLGSVTLFPNSRSLNLRNPRGLKIITRQRLGLSHLRFHKFKHSLQDTLNLSRDCRTVETNINYLLHCPNFPNEWHSLTLFNKRKSIDENILKTTLTVILFGEHSLKNVKHTSILKALIETVISTKRFDVGLYRNWELSICLWTVYFKFLSWIFSFNFVFSTLTISYLDYFVK